MALRIYNSLGRKKEPFETIEPGKVRMYVCGPTVYDSCHIGHARSVVVFDVIFRYLQALGLEVTYVRNFTDVDDKIIKRANELGIPAQELADRYIDEFYQDMDALNVKRATIEPKATQHIDQMITVIERLFEKKLAYTVDGDVFFSVAQFDGYGKLSGRRLEDMEAGARVDVDKRKRNPFDFVLWKAAKPNEPFWESPWGKGRPGWHIECSAMSSTYLGQSLDIHGGGKDLTFPHHENEVAQSEAAFDKPFVRYWVHNGFVNINSEKMSKSLGNFLMVKDVLKKYHPETVRLFLLSNHYRSPIDFTDKALDESATALDKIYALLKRIADTGHWPQELHNEEQRPQGDIWKRFGGALDDDFNTAGGIGVLFESVRRLNRLLDQCNDRPDPQIASALSADTADLLRLGSILGIMGQTPEAYFEQTRAHQANLQSADSEEIERLIAQRNAARKDKNWAEADRIRDQLGAMKVVLEDKPDKTVWRFEA
jgi:cysteinyl-tRNA synthetase